MKEDTGEEMKTTSLEDATASVTPRRVTRPANLVTGVRSFCAFSEGDTFWDEHDVAPFPIDAETRQFLKSIDLELEE